MQSVVHLVTNEEETNMALLKAPLKKPKTATLQLRLEEEVKFKLVNYAQFIDATPSYVMSEALKLLFRRDDEFKHWLERHPNNASSDHEIEGAAIKTSS
jgi:predicted transcriptional regulator